MGLDLGLAGLILFSGLRGWLKGFVAQAIRLTALVAAVYAAAPIREQVKPYVDGQLPSIGPELLDLMLLWAAAIAAFVLLVTLGSTIVAVSRRQTFGISEPNRGDQFAGFGLGLAKGAIVACFVVAGLQKFAEPQLDKVAWAEEQKTGSYAWKWHEQYHPAAQIWKAPPVQNFVQHVQKMTPWWARGASKPEASGEKPVQTASRTPNLAIPNGELGGLDTTGVDAETVNALRSILDQLDNPQ